MTSGDNKDVSKTGGWYLRLEPLQVLVNKERTELLDPVRSMWLLG